MESLRLNGVPANLDAEKALLGAILIDNEAMENSSDSIR